MADFKPRIFVYESLMFLAVQFIAIITGAQLVGTGKVTIPPPEGGAFRLGQFLIAFIIALVLIVLILRFLKTPLTFGLFFAFLIFIGAQTVFGAFLPLIISIILAIAVVVLRWWKPNIITHNFAIFLGVAGVS